MARRKKIKVDPDITYDNFKNKPALWHGKATFPKLTEAFRMGRVAVMEFERIDDSKKVAVLCMVNGPNEKGEYEFVPVAEFFSQDTPYLQWYSPKEVDLRKERALQ